MQFISEAKWRKYKADFLSVNHCTDDEFEQAYIAFMESHKRKPSVKDYRQCARKYGITILPDPNLPEDARIIFSVSISAIKVMAKTFSESEAAIKELLSDMR